MLWLFRWVGGVLGVTVQGDLAEQLLNICARNGITVWQVKRVKNAIRCRIGIRDFRRLPRLVRGKGLRLHIFEKSGLPFLLARYRKRPGIPLGAALFFALLRLLSCFIWTVEVTGNQAVTAKEVITACKEIGIGEGTAIKQIDFKTAGQELLLRLPDLAWCSLNAEGCRLTVDVSEVNSKSEKTEAPSNLKAAADGIITKIDLRSGQCMVKVGDTVREGDLLVSGVMEQESGISFVRSVGSVTAKTVRELTLSEPFSETGRQRTGKTAVKRVLSFFGVRLPLFLGTTPAPYEAEQREKTLSFFGKDLPVRMTEKRFYFTETVTIHHTEQALKSQLEKRLVEEAGEGATVTSADFFVEKEEIGLRAIVENEEEIAKEEKLLFNTGNP